MLTYVTLRAKLSALKLYPLTPRLLIRFVSASLSSARRNLKGCRLVYTLTIPLAGQVFRSFNTFPEDAHNISFDSRLSRRTRLCYFVQHAQRTIKKRETVGCRNVDGRVLTIPLAFTVVEQRGPRKGVGSPPVPLDSPFKRRS